MMNFLPQEPSANKPNIEPVAIR